MEIEPKIVSYTRSREDGSIQNRHLNDVANTIHGSTGQGGNTDMYVAEPNVLAPKRTEYGKKMRKAYESGDVKMSRHDFQEMQPRTDGVSNTITSVEKDNYLAEPSFRIRKLTERECFRLMGLADTEISKIQASGVSRSQQYKMAGNSIVVDVLFHIFRKLYIEPQCEHQQLTLF